MGDIVNLNQLVTTAASNYILQNEAAFKSDVVGPTGPAGVNGTNGTNGDQGVQGLTGKSSYDIWIEDGNTGSVSDYVDSIKGQQGDIGPDGPQGIEGTTGSTGIQGVSVHHVVGTETTDPEGDFATSGETDTFTLYGDAGETINLGYFRVTNGENAYQYAIDGGFTGTVEDFTAALGMINDIVAAANDAVGLAQTHANDAGVSAATAEKWAEETEDVEVTTGKYSAHHWATKAETTTLAAQVVADSKLNIVDITNDLTSTSTVIPISALAGKNLNDAIVAINTLLLSDDTTLDELQEIVDFIKLNRDDLDAMTLDTIVEGVTNKHFTATEQLKLAGIEIAATGDQTSGEIEALYEGILDTNKYTDAEKLLVGDVPGLLTALSNLQTEVEW